MIDVLVTYNSKFDSNGNRYNLVVNQLERKIYWNHGHVFDFGQIYDNEGIREIKNKKEKLLREGFVLVEHSEARLWGNVAYELSALHTMIYLEIQKNLSKPLQEAGLLALKKVVNRLEQNVGKRFSEIFYRL